MRILLRAVITGFGLSVGAALYKRVAKQLGLDEKSNDNADSAQRAGGVASDPGGLRTDEPTAEA